MTRIFPCRLCPLRDGCNLREGFRQRAAATGAVAISYYCPKLARELRPGRRIVIRHPARVPYHGDPDDYDYRIEKREVNATITAASGRHQFVATVDPGQIEIDDGAYSNPRFRKRQPHYRIVRFLDEPDATICQNGNVQFGGGCDCRDGLCLCNRGSASAHQATIDQAGSEVKR